MNDTRLAASGSKYIFIHKLPLSIFVFVLIAFSLLWIWGPEQAESYNSKLNVLQDNSALAMRLADEGNDFSDFVLIDPDFNIPDDYPLRDNEGNLIPQNIAIVKNLINEQYVARQISLTSANGPYSYQAIIAQLQWQSFIPLLVFWAIWATMTFIKYINNSQFDSSIAQHKRFWPFIKTKVIPEVIFIAVCTVVLSLMTTYAGIDVYSGLTNAPDVSVGSILMSGFFFNLIWLSIWIFFLYFSLYGLVSIITFKFTKSYNWAILSSLIIAGLSLGIIFQFTTCDQQNLQILNNVIPITLGHNVNSLHQYLWLNNHDSDCYNAPSIAALITLFYTGIIYIGLWLVSRSIGCNLSSNQHMN